MRTLNLWFACLALCALAGCSSQTAYLSMQNWQRQQCLKLPDRPQQQRCLDSNATSYEDYQQQKDAVKSNP